MVKKKTFYITTAIDYVNAQPHIGHAYEKVLADAVARWKRAQGYDVLYVTGTDENAQKNVQAAEEAGIPVKEFVDKNSKYFIELCTQLNISNDDFIRTTEARHIKIAQEIFKKVYDKGDIYKGKYKGYYCKGCEAFVTEKDLVEGKCPEHNKKPELISEDAYFFKLSKYTKQILNLLENGLVIPQTKANEIISRLKEEGLRDLNVSRTNLDWGIDSPIDKKFKIYVWFDALINYLTAASGKNKKYWPADCHAVGKGINWFHSVIWPAMLLSAGLKVPKLIWVHGYLTIDGQKMSKSLGNVVNPLDLLKKYPCDSVRYFLLREVPFENDGNFSEEALIQRHNDELANKLGNLVSRVEGLIEKTGVEKCPNKLIKELRLKEIEKFMEGYHVDKALNEIFAFIDICNEYVQSKKPWETHDKKVLFELKESILKIAELLTPFIPESAEKIIKQFSAKKIVRGEILFKKIETEASEKSKIIKEQETKKIEGIVNMNQIKYEDFAKLELKVGTIKKVEDIEGADKLYKLEVETGKGEKRTICAGIKQNYTKDELKGKQVVVICNLEPRKIKGVESNGMILAASNEDHSKVVLLSPEKKIDSGSKVQ